MAGIEMGVNDVVDSKQNKQAVDGQFDFNDITGATKNIESGETAKCNDVMWICIFMVQFLFFMYLGIDAIAWFGDDSPVPGPNGETLSNIGVITTYLGMPEDEMLSMTSSCGLGLVIVMIYSMAWLYTMRLFEGKVIYVSMVALLIVQWVFPGLFGAEPNAQYNIIYDAIMFIVVFWCRSSIPLVEAILANALQVLHENWAPIGISYIFVFLSAAVQGIYIFAFISLLLKSTTTEYTVGMPEFLGMYLSYCWTRNVLTGIVHFTIAGVTASWALLGSDSPAPTMGALKRAMTGSFGSICYAGIVVAFAEILESLLKYICCAPRYVCPCFVSCIFTWIEEMIRMYNVYTLSECAIFGCSYCEGVGRFNEVFKSRGMEAITVCVLTVIPFTVAANCGFWIIIALILGFLNDVTVSSPGMILFLIVMILAMYIFGNSLVYATICMVESAIATIFIVWAEDPDSFAQNQPEQFDKIRNATLADPGVVNRFKDNPDFPNGFPAALNGGRDPPNTEATN